MPDASCSKIANGCTAPVPHRKKAEESDPYYRRFNRFMSIVTYSRPAGELYPKLTLLETMGVILKKDLQEDYLKRVLPRYDRTFPADYRVELKMNDSIVKVLQRGRASRAPVLRFHFIDSAANIRNANSPNYPMARADAVKPARRDPAWDRNPMRKG